MVLCSTEKNNKYAGMKQHESTDSFLHASVPHSAEMNHGEDFVRLVPPKASKARTSASIKHGTFTKYAVLHRQEPPLRASPTQRLFVLQLLSSAILSKR